MRSIRHALTERIATLRRTVDGELDEVAGEQRLAELEDVGRGASSLETAVALLELGEAELGALEAAVARIDAGTYGQCEGCERPIPDERLLALPMATRCIDCQRESEREDDAR